MATEKPRYTVSVDNDLFQQIEDFRFEHRFQTRSEATVELIRLGLESLKKNNRPLKNQNNHPAYTNLRLCRSGTYICKMTIRYRTATVKMYIHFQVCNHLPAQSFITFLSIYS